MTAKPGGAGTCYRHVSLVCRNDFPIAAFTSHSAAKTFEEKEQQRQDKRYDKGLLWEPLIISVRRLKLREGN